MTSIKTVWADEQLNCDDDDAATDGTAVMLHDN
jgi:hypothetical protein